MTFAEKLLRLRKREGLSQEALAEQLGVSRQAVSRWEQGTALPDGAKLLPCARIFGVSVDWLLDEALGWEDQPAQPAAEAPASGNRKWYLAGGLVTGAGVLGLVVMGILSALYPAVVSEAPLGVDWVRVYTGVPAFLKLHGVETRLCMFYGEDHGLSRTGKPSNRICRMEEILAWLDGHLKEGETHEPA